MNEETVFHQAKTLPASGRAAFLEQACGSDAALRGRIESLLHAHENPGSFMAAPVADAALALNREARRDAGDFVAGATEAGSRADEPVGQMIGRYKLLQRIGEGGFGTVFMAEQQHPVRRRVALKIIKLGMDTRAVITRFEAERQALAMMDHPNIARVLDAGSTDSGRPYFVMELVKGIPITDYCDQANLDMRQRLELFMDVCRAVQHAHQKGVIHRDLKPSNIMITLHDAKPVVKVIDFGIAKATDQKLTDKTLFTNYGQMIGTPVYMSPEQAVMSGLDVDTRSDIYSLGVLLYELLTGSPPFDAQTLRSAGFDEMRRIIREQQPQKPSTRLSTLAEKVKLTVATQRQVSPQVLSRQLQGDLDWIILKAIEKDRGRRYDTANGLAGDLKRYLENEPVLARPPSAVYRFQKAVRRNKLTFTAGAAVAAALVIGIAVSVWQAKRAVAALDELRATAPAFAEQARSLVERDRFDEALDKLAYAIKLRPDAPEYLIAKGDLLQSQLRLTDAAAAYRAALALRPGDTRAKASAVICDELLAFPGGKDGKLTRESLSKLLLIMQAQQRPAAELMPVARMLGDEKKLIVTYWLARLKDMPISAEKPLEKRLTVRDDGLLALDLSGTKIANLSPLAGAPLAVLDLTDAKELTDISALRGMSLIELHLNATKVTDLAPLQGMRTLEELKLSSTPVSDLSPLRGLPLKKVDFTGCPVSDIAPLRGAPLEELILRETRVADISPLAGMPLKSIDLSAAPVLDFAPLKGLPLEKCFLQRNRLTDLAVLRGMPLRELVLWGCAEARNYAVLDDITTLELLLLPSEYRSLPEADLAAIGSLRTHPKLRQLGSEIMDRMGYAATGSKELFWKEWESEQSFVPALRKCGFTFNLLKLPSGTYSLFIQGQPLSDLSSIKGAPISELTVSSCKIEDLTPIRELPLEFLDFSDNPVTDLGPLRGMKIKRLYMVRTKVSDLSPLKGMPLTELYLDQCDRLTDLAALAEIPTLEKVTVPAQARNVAVLRGRANLRMLDYRLAHGFPLIPASTAEKFWKDYETNIWIARLRDSGLKIKTLNKLDDGTWELSLENSGVTDLKILSGAPISSLWLGTTMISDLSPLRGLPLKTLQMWSTDVTDLSPLHGMKIETLNLNWTKVIDLSPLHGMPLVDLRLGGCTKVTDLSPIADSKTIVNILLPPNAKDLEFLRAFPHLARIGFKEDSDWLPDQTAAEFWKERDKLRWVEALKESGLKMKAPKRLDDGNWEVDLGHSEIADLKILSGAPIRILWLGDTEVSDVAPLRGMALTNLALWYTKVTDLSPLHGMPIEDLNLGGTKVTDLSPLRGMPLRVLKLHSCAELEDISALAQTKTLKSLTLPPNAKNFEFLRQLPHLERLSYREDEATREHRPDKTAAEFWKEYDAGKK